MLFSFSNMTIPYRTHLQRENAKKSPMTRFEREMALEIFIWPFAGFAENQHASVLHLSYVVSFNLIALIKSQHLP